MNVQQWREMSGYVERLVAVGAHDIGPQDVTVDANGWPSFGVRFWFGRDGAAGGLYSDVLLKIGVGQRSFVSCGDDVWWLTSMNTARTRISGSRRNGWTFSLSNA